MTVGESIKSARLKKGLTQKQVANACRMADSAIRKYESGKVVPKLETLRRIAGALGVEWTDLVDGHTAATMTIEHVGNIFNAQPKDTTKVTFNTSKLENAVSISIDRQRIDEAFNKLNRAGQQEAVKRVEELTEIPRYRLQEPPEASPAPARDTATPAAQDAPEGAEEGAEMEL